MARIDIKGISKLRGKFLYAAIAYSDANRKANGKGSVASKSLRVADRDSAADELLSLAIDLVAGLATASDGKDFAPSSEKWLAFMLSNDSAFASAMRLLKKKPYDQIFKAIEANR